SALSLPPSPVIVSSPCLPEAAQEILFSFALQLEKHEISVGIDPQKIDQAASSRPQVRVENTKSILDDPGIFLDQALGALGISGRAPDDADGQPFSARRSASLSRSTMSWQGEKFQGSRLPAGWPLARNERQAMPASVSCLSDSAPAGGPKTAVNRRAASEV
ncbi:MAG: hypothetical protein L0170_07120, partial [Acidobacteria bacterium]|nr:hypothetical protein [Acidobacteriota bacterium]